MRTNERTKMSDAMIKVKLIETIKVANPILWLLLDRRWFVCVCLCVCVFGVLWMWMCVNVDEEKEVCPFKAGCYYRIANTF